MNTRSLAFVLVGIFLSSANAQEKYSSTYEYEDGAYQDDYNPTRPYRSELGRNLGYAPEYVVHGLYRQPVSVLVLNDDVALVATKLTGQMFVLDLATWEVRQGLRIADANWGDLCLLENGLLAATETGNEQVVLMRWKDDSLKVVARLDAPGYPSRLTWDADAKTLLASARWSRRIYRWRIANDEQGNGALAQEYAPAEIPLAGGEIIALPKQDLVMVVDDFGRDFALLSRKDYSLIKHGQLYGHNVTGLASTPDQDIVYFPHQLLNEYAQSVVNDITWGGLMSNNLRWLQVERLIEFDGHDMFKKGRFYPLGTPGNGAGDPSSMAVSSTGRVAVTLAGTDRVTIGKEGDYYFKQVPVGMRPVDCAYTRDDEHLIVVNQFSDSLSIVTLADMTVKHIALGPIRPPTQLEQGEIAFFNSRLSHDGWMSCHSCHSDGHTNGQLNDNFTDHTYGTPKRVLTLLGQSRTLPYAWNGEVPSLEHQVKHSLESTMAHGQPADRSTVNAIAAFVRSLPAPPSVARARLALEERRAIQNRSDDLLGIHKGRELFSSLSCNDCHAGARFTSAGAFDVGLQDEESMRLFNPPSLVAVGQRQNSLFHDGRAHSLDDVLVKEKHQLSRDLSEEEIGHLVSFLESL